VDCRNPHHPEERAARNRFRSTIPTLGRLMLDSASRPACGKEAAFSDIGQQLAELRSLHEPSASGRLFANHPPSGPGLSQTDPPASERSPECRTVLPQSEMDKTLGRVRKPGRRIVPWPRRPGRIAPLSRRSRR
jgi:hypothetical protein